MPEGEPPSPYLAQAKARVLVELGEVDEAITLLSESRRYYPDIADNNKLLAELMLAQGADDEALALYAHAAEINPFDVTVQQALADLYRASGERTLAARHAANVGVLEFRN